MVPVADPVAYLLAPLLAAALLFGAAWAAGDRILNLSRLNLRRGERVVLALVAGLPVLGTAGMVLGLLGWLRPVAVLALLAAPVLLAPLRRRREAGGEPVPSAPIPGRWVRRACVALTIVFAAANLVRALYPPAGFDALNYHLPALRRYLETGTLSFPTDLRFAAGPGLHAVLFALPAAFGGDLAAQLVSWGMGVLGGLVVFVLARRLFGPTAAAAALTFYYTTPIVGWLSSEAYIDLGATLFTTMALAAVALHLVEPQRGWAAMAGLAAGAALGCRYLAAVPLLLLALDLLSAPSHPQRRGLRRRLGALAVFLGIAVMVASPWYVRNAVETGNPVFPLFNDALGGRLWTADDVQQHRAFLREVGPGRGLDDLLLVPLRLALQPGRFGGSTGTSIGLTHLLVLPLLWPLRRHHPLVPLLGSYAAGVTLAWFYSSQQTRFLLPALAVTALLGGFAVQEIAEGWLPVRWWLRRAVLALAVVAAGAGGTRWPSEPPPLGAARRAEFLRRRVTGYGRIDEINRLLPDGAVVYAFGEEGRRYYYRCRLLGDWFGPTAYRRFLPDGDPGEIVAGWRRLGVTHLITRDDFPSRAIRVFRERPYWWDRLVPLRAWSGVRLYRLSLPDPDRPAGREAAQTRGGGPPHSLTLDPAET